MTKLGVLVFLTIALVGRGGGTKSGNPGQPVPFDGDLRVLSRFDS